VTNHSSCRGLESTLLTQARPLNSIRTPAIACRRVGSLAIYSIILLSFIICVSFLLIVSIRTLREEGFKIMFRRLANALRYY